MAISDVIYNIRKQYNLSQDQMAERLFVTRQAVSRWETGTASPGIDTIKLIANTFNVSASELLEIPKESICQSCGMDLKAIDDFGTLKDNVVHTDYCTYCFRDGEFVNERTVDDMVESNLRFLDEYNKEKGLNFTPEQARTELRQHLMTLKRWRR